MNPGDCIIFTDKFIELNFKFTPDFRRIMIGFNAEFTQGNLENLIA